MIPVVYLKCCRVWPIALGNPVGKCGICGHRPRERATAEDVAAYVDRRVSEMRAP